MEKEVDDETEESEEDSEETTEESLKISEETIEDLVNQSSLPSMRTQSQPTFTPQLISPVLESRPIHQTPPLETGFQETSTSTTQTENQDKPYNNSNYYNKQEESAEDPEIIQNINPTLEQDFSRVRQNIPRLTPTDTNLVTPNTARGWEKKYETKFAEQKRDRRRL